MSHTIELRKVSKYYADEDTVSMGFSRIDLDLDIGEFVAITGESGSGKSTLLNVISGLDTYEEGEMFVCGEDTTAYNTEDYEVYRKTYIGNIFQDFNLINSYTVYQNIEIVMLLAGRKAGECSKRVNKLIKLVGLSKYRNTKVSKLSGGQKQRVAIARALAKDAPIIVADEPTGNLDSKSAQSVMETLARVSGDKLVVIVTHNYEQAEPYVTRKITMHDGKIIEDKQITATDEASADDSLEDSTEQHFEWADDYTSENSVDDNVDASMAEAEVDEDIEHVPAITSELDALIERIEQRTSDEKTDLASADTTETDLAEESKTNESAEATDPQKDSEADADNKRIGRVKRFSSIGTRFSDGKPKSGMLKRSELMLGARNTFNLPAKFILLFIVYFFVSTAVLGQYATTKNSMHESELLGKNPYFASTSSDRIIVKKTNESVFTERDFKAVSSTPNIRAIVKNDLAVDSGVSFSLDDFYVEGTVMPLNQISKSDLTYGHMPRNSYEIVIRLDGTSNSIVSIGEKGDAYIGAKIILKDMTQMQTYYFNDDIRIAGIIVNKNTDDDSDNSTAGYSTIYVSEKVSNELLVSMMADSSKADLIFGETKVSNEYDRSIYSSSKVPEGKVYLFEDQQYFYEDEKAVGKKFGLKVSNRFFESEGEYTVDKIITEKNCEKLVGISKEEYDMFVNCVFISNEDYEKLFDKGYYQISAYMINEQESDATQEALRQKGFTTLALKESLGDTTGGYDSVIDLISYGRLLIEFIILFFIAYAVIKLIMRSRNSYYSTLRMLGATKKNTSNILRVELILMMIIAYGVDIAFVLLTLNGTIDSKEISKLLFYLTPVDYAALAAVLLIMSLLIANRYSRNIFNRSAMKAFREEA